MQETPDPGADSGVIDPHTEESTELGTGLSATAAPNLALHLDQPPEGPRYLFFGRDGLRAGWGLLLFFVLFFAFLNGGGLLLQKVLRNIQRHTPTAAAQHQSQRNPSATAAVGISPKSVFVSEGLAVFSVLLATWLMAKIERRKVATYGFNRQHALRNFCAGLAAGVVTLSLLIALLRATGLLVFDARLLFGRSILGYGLLWLAGFLTVAIAEESVTRAYAQFTLTRGLRAIYRLLVGEAKANALGFWTAALVLSFAFGFGHRANPGESPLGLISAGLAGFLFCFSLWRTGSLWWAIGFHATWDWAQSFLYGVADSGLMVRGHLFATHPVGRPILSGGLTGPEGSVLLLPVITVAMIVIYWSLPRTNFGYLPASPSPAAVN